VSEKVKVVVFGIPTDNGVVDTLICSSCSRSYTDVNLKQIMIDKGIGQLGFEGGREKKIIYDTYSFEELLDMLQGHNEINEFSYRDEREDKKTR